MKPVTRLPVEAPEAALSITNREDEDNSFLKYKRAVGVNSLRHQLDEDVSVA